MLPIPPWLTTSFLWGRQMTAAMGVNSAIDYSEYGWLTVKAVYSAIDFHALGGLDNWYGNL
jgi:hypothetical protein